MNETNIPEKLLTPYNPQETEPRLYTAWEQSGYFNPDVCIKEGLVKPDAPTFSIVMPPPNVTGVLHMGHALMLTVEDVMVRYKRMQGFRTLWIPGTDHAAIATQSKVEKIVTKEEKINPRSLGREELLKRIEQFAQDSHDTIVSQVKTMGASCDWSREAFTLDEVRTKAVRTVFKQMYDDGLIYRSHRVVNWDPKGQTTISDDEIVTVERQAQLYTFKYSPDFPIAISTTRPETKVGDTAVAVHPDDARYTAFIGKEYSFEFCGVPVTVKIIADESVEPEFGTGALGVTPAHSMTDWEIAQRHNLKVVPVINEYAKMTVGDDRLLGKKVTDAREAVVAWLKESNLMINEETITQQVPTAERTDGIIEPLPKLQWFIDVNKPIPGRDGKTLKELVKEPVANGNIAIVPDYFSKTYFHWIDNLRDWCISRQIWYGHRIPVWYKGEELYCGVDAPEGEGWAQDEDTLDTWFSSGMWTFSTLGWPEQTPDFQAYHPTDVLETGYDILFFWVARMVLMTQYALHIVPFKTIYLHGLVRDVKGQKMSKSLGNAMDPMDVAKEFGADAGRMALVVGTAPGTDSKISNDKIKGYKNFANKLWNITRFVRTHTADTTIDDPIVITEQDSELINESDALIAEVTADLDNHRYHIASEKIYGYVWRRFADVILEESKIIFAEGTDAEKQSRQKTLLAILGTSLKLLHPFMPFVTEELWSMIPERKTKKLLIIESWPTSTLPR